MFTLCNRKTTGENQQRSVGVNLRDIRRSVETSIPIGAKPMPEIQEFRLHLVFYQPIGGSDEETIKHQKEVSTIQAKYIFGYTFFCEQEMQVEEMSDEVMGELERAYGIEMSIAIKTLSLSIGRDATRMDEDIFGDERDRLSKKFVKERANLAASMCLFEQGVSFKVLDRVGVVVEQDDDALVVKMIIEPATEDDDW